MIKTFKFFSLALMSLTLSSPLAAADKVVVVGGTSKTGIAAIRLAQEAGYDVTGTTRSLERAQERYGNDIDWAVVDIKVRATITAAFEDADYVISSIGSLEPTGDNRPENVDYKGVVNMVDAAISAGVKRFVLISSAGAGGDVRNRLNYIFNNILVWKWLGEDYLRDSEIESAILRPGSLNDDPGGVTGIDLLQIDSTASRRQVPRGDVAAVAVYCLTHVDCQNKTFEMFSDLEGAADGWKSTLAGLKEDDVTFMAMPQR
ncbi:MAG: SDR family oxidoreductase [Rhodospirillaceae bacterium]|nr:SDR family oxidoreductase [Rhodospirillaceae bacterium]